MVLPSYHALLGFCIVYFNFLFLCLFARPFLYKNSQSQKTELHVANLWDYHVICLVLLFIKVAWSIPINLAGTGSPTSPIQLHSCRRCTRGRDWKCKSSYLVTFFLLLHAVYLYQYHPVPVSPSDIDARKIDLIPCCLTWIPCVLQICVRVRDNADLATMSVDGFITRLKEEIVAFRWFWCCIISYYLSVVD